MNRSNLHTVGDLAATPGGDLAEMIRELEARLHLARGEAAQLLEDAAHGRYVPVEVHRYLVAKRVLARYGR